MEFYKELLEQWSTDSVNVFLVDGEYIRNHINIDFVEGGNDLACDYIPQGEVWGDNANENEIPFIVLHELHERNLMLQGMEYDPAHDAANIVETDARQNPDKVNDLIMAELSQGAKAMESMIRKIYSSEVKEAGDRTLEFTISTEDIDRDEECIKAEGWNLTNYLKNPVVLWAHQYDEPPVGKAVYIAPKDGKLVSRVLFADKETYPFADTVYRLCKGGFLSATSVGFQPNDWEIGQKEGDPKKTYLKQELLEFSIVPVPSNPNALQNARDAGVITMKELNNIQCPNFSLSKGIYQKGGIVTKPEETENYIRIPVESPDKHKDHKIRTIEVSGKEGIKGIYCVDCKKIITYLFDKAKDWTMAKAEAWVKEHGKSEGTMETKGAIPLPNKDTSQEKSISEPELIDELDYVRSMIKEIGLPEKAKALAEELANEILLRMPATKKLLVRDQKAIDDALKACKDAQDIMDVHSKAHKAAHKAHKELITKTSEILQTMGTIQGDEEPNEKPEEGKSLIAQILGH